MNPSTLSRFRDGTLGKKQDALRTLILSLAITLATLNAWAWDNDVVHPQITQGGLNWLANNRGIQELQQWGFFNISSSPQCSFIDEGSVKEDIGAASYGSWNTSVWGTHACYLLGFNWMNHGYHPPTGGGWWQLSSLNAVDYAAGIWTDAIADYRAGRRSDAFFKLGRLCHLLEDMSSPAHTQADVHASGDDAEAWGAAHYSASTYAPSQMRRPSTHGYGSLSSDTVQNFLKNLAWRTYYASAWQGRLVTELGHVQPDSELKRMFPALEYENDWLTPDYWVIPEVGYFYNGSGNSEWWRCEGNNGDGTGYYYFENINQDGGGPTYPNPGAWVMPQKRRADFFRRTLSSDNLDGVLVANSQPLVELYAANLYPVAAEWVAGLMKVFLEEADNVPPQVAGTSANTTPGTDIYVFFNEDMDESTLTGANITVVGSATGGHSCSFTFDHDAYLLTINPSSDFAYGETVTVTLTSGVKDQGAEGIDGDRNGTVGPSYPFTFQIRQAPPGSPTAISVTVNSVSGTVDPYQTITISGTATYNTGQSVNGTATIDTGDAQYTTPVVNGSYSRPVTGPGASRNVTVSVTDGPLTGNGSVYVSVSGDGGTPNYDLTTDVIYDHNDLGDGYVEYWYKDAFRTTDRAAGLIAVFENADISSDLSCLWRFYYPNGDLYGTESTYTFPHTSTRGWAYRGKLIAGNAMQEPGRYKVNFYINGSRKARHYFVVGWDFTEHKMCKSIQGEEDGGVFLPQGVTSVFSPDDIRAIAWHEFEYRAQRLDVKTEFYGPTGAGYRTNEYTFVDDLDADEWYDWSRHASWIYVNGNAAQRMCGSWTVKFYVKNPTSTAWDIQYTNYFRIEEGTAPSVTATGTPSVPVESQSLVVNIQASDNNDLQRVVLHWNDGSAHEQTWDNINAATFSTTHTIGTSLGAGQQIEYWCEAFDESGNRSESARGVVVVQPETVSAPTTPVGTNAATSGESIAFSTGGSTTRSGAGVDYQFDWGDGPASSWGGSVQSHAWLTAGTYQVKARARSQAIPARISDWSAPLEITIAGPASPPGTLDAGFGTGVGPNGTVYWASQQPDGKVLISGAFTTVDGQSRNRVARLNSDASLDSSFDPGSGADGIVDVVLVQTDGKIVVGGRFTHFNGLAVNRIARLNPNGSVDGTFNPGTGADSTVWWIIEQPDHRLLLGGTFSTLGGVSRSRVGRLNPDGSLDSSFDPGSGANGTVEAMALQPDGRVMVVGTFSQFNGQPRGRIVRLYPNGNIDPGFNSAASANGSVYWVAMQSDGNILLGGSFSSVNGVAHSQVARLTADGNQDGSFNASVVGSWVFPMAVQSDGKIVIGGSFSSVNGVPCNRIARLLPDGTLDTAFNIGSGANSEVRTVVLQADGKILLGGAFTAFNGAPRNRIARLIGDDPYITRQPVSQEVPVGATVNFAVIAAGTPPLSYAWYRDGMPLSDGGGIAGSGSPNLTLANVSAVHQGNYSVLVTAGSNSVASVAAALNVVPGVLGNNLVVGDLAGRLTLVDLQSGTVANSTNLFPSGIARVDILDLQRDGSVEVLAAPLNAANQPTYALQVPSLGIRWQTDRSTAFSYYGEELGGGPKIWSGDFDGDGQMEILIPFHYNSSVTNQIFSAVDGRLEFAFPSGRNWLPVAYHDAGDNHFKFITEVAPNSFTHYLCAEDLMTRSALWTNSSVNTWKLGAVSASMIDGLPRLWGGWYGRTLYVVGRNGSTLWQKSFGGSYEAEGVYAGDLRGDGVEAILVGGTYGSSQIRLDAARLSDGVTLWTYNDATAYWFTMPIAVEDVDGNGAKEVFIYTGGQSGSRYPKYQAINGTNGARIWEQAYAYDASMPTQARIADVNGDGRKELLVAVNNTIEARDALTGALVRTYTFGANVTTFELTPMSSLRATAQVSASGYDFVIRFPTAIGKTYRVECREDLSSGAWSRVVQDNITGTGGYSQVIDWGIHRAQQRFYRIVAW